MPALSTPAFVLIVITAIVILIFRDWRFNALALAVQYLAAFILISLSWPIGMAVVKLIVGLMASAAIAFTFLHQKYLEVPNETEASLFFRGFAGLLVVLTVFLLTPALHENVFTELDIVVLQGGLMLIGMALMQLGTNSNPYLTVISLLSLLSGFEVIYAGLETSTLLTGLLAVVNLGLALVGVYFITKAVEPEDNTNQEERS
jgi:hypothetical protein